jgi:hypothetical protein
VDVDAVIAESRQESEGLLSALEDLELKMEEAVELYAGEDL